MPIIVHEKHLTSNLLNSRLFLFLKTTVDGIILIRKVFLSIIFFNEASRGAGAQSVTVKPTGCRFDPH